MAQTRRQITTLIRRYIDSPVEARGIPVERVILLLALTLPAILDEWSDIDIAVISPKFDTLSLLERYEQLGLANRRPPCATRCRGIFFAPRWQTASPRAFLPNILRTGVDGAGAASQTSSASAARGYASALSWTISPLATLINLVVRLAPMIQLDEVKEP